MSGISKMVRMLLFLKWICSMQQKWLLAYDGIVVLCVHLAEDWPRGYKPFLSPTQLSMTFILPINVKIPTIVGILTYISRINTSYESLKAKNTNFLIVLVFMSSWNLCSVELSIQMFYNLEAWLDFFNCNLFSICVPLFVSLCLFLIMPLVGLCYAIVAFPGHTNSRVFLMPYAIFLDTDHVLSMHNAFLFIKTQYCQNVHRQVSKKRPEMYR